MSVENDPANGIFRHKCIVDSCDNHIIYDDEPRCYSCSPDSGSSVRGYSAYAEYLASPPLHR
jgi:hypothetical protein